VLSTVPQTIFGPKNLVKGRLQGFAIDIRKLSRMAIAEHTNAVNGSDDNVCLDVMDRPTIADDKTLWMCFKRVWSQL